jgi:hypothetical protein
VIGVTIQYAIDLVVIAFCIAIGGLSVYLYFMRDSRMLWSIVGLVATILMRGIALNVSEILLLDQTPVPTNYLIELSTIIALSIVTTIIVIFVTQRLGKRLDIYFTKEEIIQ